MIIGYTAGVFDLFHVGHLRILQQAKKQCDRLIVGVSSDELVIEYKAKKPIIPAADRMEIVSAIQYVDEVVAQNDRDKIAAYHRYKFDIMFVGDDWKGSPLFEEVERELVSYGSKIIYFPYTNNVSSTQLTSTLNTIEEEGRGL